ncbi:MAG: mechanosensitive ion channel [Candidatus Erginobacter occultus]|nr:mechanosensitive ion channel [Candidatus Erginobacter occultus]
MDIQNLPDQLTIFLAEYGLKLIGAVLILIVGRILSGLLRKLVTRILGRLKTDPAIVSFSGTLVYVLILIFTVVAALANLGVEMTSFIALIGAAGLAIGFALQGTLGNFAAGILILIFRPFKIGDWISAAGVLGRVSEIQIFETVLVTADNIRITVPNGKIYGDVIENITTLGTRRLEVEVGISYSSSIKKAHEILLNLCRSDPRVLAEPAPQAVVSELGDSSVNFKVRPWVKVDDYWDLKFDLTRKIKETFDEQGIEIPFPQRVVHMVPTPEEPDN